MSFQWLQMRITEEQERRLREAAILSRLPQALHELHELLGACVKNYTESFGPESRQRSTCCPPNSASLSATRTMANGSSARKFEDTCAMPTIPGFQVDRPGGEPLILEIGVLPGDKVFYRDRESDQYLNTEELTRRILDRGFFPKLGE